MGEHDGTPRTVRSLLLRAAACNAVRASPLRMQSAMVSFFNLGPYASVRVELQAVTPLGPYRLEIDHPAKKIVEYFETPFAALARHAEIESTLTGIAR